MKDVAHEKLCIHLAMQFMLYIQNIHSATQDFEAGQREEKQKFIQVSVHIVYEIFILSC